MKIIFDMIGDFIFNPTIYLCSIPVWVVIWALFLKYAAGLKVTIGDIPLLIIILLFNPLLYFACAILIIMIPFIFFFGWLDVKVWQKIKDKKLL